jgi:hypothetical protein
MRTRVLIACIMVVGAFAVPVAAHASPPSNDNFANAAPLVPISGLQTTIDLTEATYEASEPRGCGYNPTRSAWFRITPPAVDLGFVVESYTAGVSIAVYSGTTLPSLSLVGCSSGGYDPSPIWYCCDIAHVATWQPTGAVMYVQVTTSSVGIADVRAQATSTGDDWRTGLVPSGAPATSFTRSANTPDLTTQPLEPAPGCGIWNATGSAFFGFHAGVPGVYRLQATSDRGPNGDSGFVSVLAIDANGTLHAIGCVRPFDPPASVTLTPAACYLLEIGTSGNEWHEATVTGTVALDL